VRLVHVAEYDPKLALDRDPSLANADLRSSCIIDVPSGYAVHHAGIFVAEKFLVARADNAAVTNFLRIMLSKAEAIVTTSGSAFATTLL
jgi:hypothetical protein